MIEKKIEEKYPTSLTVIRRYITRKEKKFVAYSRKIRSCHEKTTNNTRISTLKVLQKTPFEK